MLGHRSDGRMWRCDVETLRRPVYACQAKPPTLLSEEDRLLMRCLV